MPLLLSARPVFISLDIMTDQELISEIRNYCIANASAENAVKYSHYFKEGHYDGYGLSAPQQYSKAKELLKNPGVSMEAVLNSGDELISSGRAEEISIIMLVMKGFYKEYTRTTFDRLADWYQHGISNWAHADTMGMMVLPPFLLRKIIDITAFTSWLTAENKFQRRSVPVTLIKALKTQDRYAGLFAFIECLMTDSEREVHQGTGWFLREAWKRTPEETEAFLMKWKDKSPRLIFQYATEKMPKEYRLKFRKAKK